MDQQPDEHMSTRKRIDALTDALAKAWADKDAEEVSKLRNELSILKAVIEREIDLRVAQCFILDRNFTKHKLN